MPGGERVCYLAFCPECDAEVAPDDETCPDCGTSLYSSTETCVAR